MRTLKGAACAALTMALALTAGGCPKKGTDSGTPGTDAAEGTDATMGTDSAPLPSDAGAGATFTGLVYEILDDTTPVAGATVELFDVSDTAGTTVLASATSDAAGLAAMTLPTVPQNVYAKVSGAPMGTDTYSYWNFPVTTDTMRDTPFYSTTTYGIVMGLFGQMAGMGYASGAVLNCTGARLAGATVTASSGTVLYIDNGTGFPSMMMPPPTATDVSGAYIVVNVAPGTLTIDVSLPAPPTGCATMAASHDVEARADTPLIAVTLVP